MAATVATIRGESPLKMDARAWDSVKPIQARNLPYAECDVDGSRSGSR